MYIRHIYDIDLCAPDGKIVRMRNYEGYIVMVVNTASECGFNDQLEEMEMCYELFKGHRFVILAFPSDQFNQEPLDDEDMITHNEAHYQVSFPMFRKVIVNGRQAHPLFRYLTNALPGILGTQSIKWNFTKFIIDRTGQPVRRFSPITNMEIVSEYIAGMIEKKP
ncbi:MAG: glutathione peroxidase [Legionellales bacterium]|jgi:glutathione peroxidase|nr:glutathione peroxidase [Legionellales bacterium]HAV93599.1 glutathione peroxidase [Pseudomonadota bacterium]